MKVKNRIKKDKEFQNVIDNGKLLKVDTLNLYYLKNQFDYPRVGLSIPTKSGNAVYRNKIKRQIRAILAKNLDFSLGYDLIFIARKKYDINDFEKTVADIKILLEKVGQ